MSDVANEYRWEDLVERDDENPGYENFTRIDFNLWTDDAGVLRAAREFTADMDGQRKQNQVCMMVVLLNLYRCWLVDNEKWLAYTRRKGNYRLCRKYNRNAITYTPLVKCMDCLNAEDFIDHALGFYFRGIVVEKGKCSRARLREEFASRLESEYGFTDNVIRRHPDEETIILKDQEKVPIEYSDTNHNDAAGKRRFLKLYNELLENTYIDLDKGDYVAKEAMWVDLSRKHNYRVYSNGRTTLRHGGRFYGGFWQGLSGELRLRLLINNMKVIECDYSGIHIYLLYAKEGVDFNTLNKDPYQLPEYEQTKEMRNFFKLLLLTALNAGNETAAKKALNRKFIKTPHKFPAQKPDFDNAIEHFKNYHRPIAHHLFKGAGHTLMKSDSDIADYVLRRMTERNIPVLSVHDSFICQKIHEELLQSTMRDAFARYSGFNQKKAIMYYKVHQEPCLRTRPSRTPRAKIKYEEHNTDESLGEYADEFMVDLLSVTDAELITRIMRYENDGVITKYAQVDIPSEQEPGGSAS